MRALLVASMLLVAGCPCGMFGSGTGCGGPSEEIDKCAQAMPATAQSLEIGPRADPFRAYQDGEKGDFEVGGQGLSMLGFRLRLTGVGEVECIAQSTSTEYPNGDGSMVGRFSSEPLRFYKQADGSRVSGTVLKPLGLYGPEVVIVSESAGQTTRVRLGR